MRAGLAAALMVAITAGPGFAHPHVFVDTALEVVFDDQGRAIGLRISWTYDEFFSLMILEDRGLDPDFDGILTPEELAVLQGFDMDWQPGFDGDTYAVQGGVALALSGPSEGAASYADAKITSMHYRSFAEPVAMGAEALVVQVYDPGFYTAYAIGAVPVVSGGRGCSAEVFEPDRAAADQILQDAMAEQAGSDGIEMAFPAIGAAYSEEARITCAASS